MTPDLRPLPDDGLPARFHAAAPVLTADATAIIARGRRRRRAARGATAALAVAAVAVAATAAVGLLRGPTEPPASTTPPPPEEPGAVSLWLSSERVPPGDTDVVAVLVSNDGTEVTFGVPAGLERWDGSAWREYRRTNMCLAEWHCTARWQAPDAAEVQGADDIGLGVAAGSPGPVERFTIDGLEPGWYRVVQEAYGGVVARGVFEVADDAPEPPPLWPVDGIAVSVQPALVAPGGGEVALVPLVPPVDGTLDEGMLTAAMAGLDDMALVQRWGPSGWDEVADVALSAPDAVSVPGELTARLPALEPGAHRVLLRGDGTELVGSFWVLDGAGGPDPSPAPAATCAADDAACLMDAWLVTLLADAGYASEPAVVGPQPDDPYAARAARVADSGGELDRLAGLLVTTTDGPDLGFDLDVEQEWTADVVTVEEGFTPDGDRAAARFTCGGFRFLARGNDAGESTRDRTWGLAEDVAARIDACPADLGELADLLAARTSEADDDASATDGVPTPPCYEMSASLCAMKLWLVDTITAAGYESGGGDHDIGDVATDSARVGDGVVWGSVSRLADRGAGDLHVATTVLVGDITVRHGSSPGVAAASELDCGAFRLTFAGDVEADVRRVTEDVAAAVGGACPVDEGELLARYAERIGPG